MKPIQTEVKKITPAYARELLDGQADNRNIRPRLVGKIASDILEGRWQTNGESIVLDENGKLLDGQHRLSAIVKANKAVSAVVVSGIPAAHKSTIDTGSARTPGDFLRMAGFKNHTHLAGVARIVWTYRNGCFPENQSSDEIPSSQKIIEIAEEIAADFELVYGFIASAYNTGQGKLVAPSWMEFLCLIVQDHHRDIAIDFVEKIYTGANVTAKMPAYHLRNTFLKNMDSGIFFTTKEKWSLLIRAWNLHEKGAECTVHSLRRTSDAIVPEIARAVHRRGKYA